IQVLVPRGVEVRVLSSAPVFAPLELRLMTILLENKKAFLQKERFFVLSAPRCFILRLQVLLRLYRDPVF
ncbi:MAG TPA: hypothetical protein PLD51_03615, partial [Pontiellaceae bacterium]|nr:hypothetical protein [Pontiellaceae bacterium]